MAGAQWGGWLSWQGGVEICGGAGLGVGVGCWREGSGGGGGGGDGGESGCVFGQRVCVGGSCEVMCIIGLVTQMAMEEELVRYVGDGERGGGELALEWARGRGRGKGEWGSKEVREEW